MNVAGLVKSSLIDYPGKIAAVIFTQGCNFRCGFCHNPDLISVCNYQLTINESEVLEFLKTRVGKLDGVVVTGGEPMIQKDLINFLMQIKSLGFAIKLDTNGSNPRELAELIKLKLIDYIAMDIKGPLDKYSEICAYSNTKVIQKSIRMIMESGLNYEFRTTVLPAYHTYNDIEKIGKLIEGAALYTLQGFRSKITLDKNLLGSISFTKDELHKLGNIIAPYVQKVVIHDNI